MIARLRQGTVDGNKIRFNEEPFEGNQLNPPGLGQIGIVPNYPQAEGGYSSGHPSTDPPAAHNAIGQTLQAVDGDSDTEIPGPRSNGLIQQVDLSHPGEKEGQGVIGNLINAIVRYIGNDDSEIGGSSQVNSVNPHAVPGNSLAPR